MSFCWQLNVMNAGSCQKKKRCVLHSPSSQVDRVCTKKFQVIMIMPWPINAEQNGLYNRTYWPSSLTIWSKLSTGLVLKFSKLSRYCLDQLMQSKMGCTIELTGSDCWPFFHLCLVEMRNRKPRTRGGISTPLMGWYPSSGKCNHLKWSALIENDEP